MILQTTHYPALTKRHSGGGKVEPDPHGGWRFSLPAGPEQTYRWAQLDDYMELSRRNFRWNPPVTLRLCARVSSADTRGTWGFGLWNDPFTASLGLGGMARRLPALPNTAWFFHASPPNYLSLRDDLPALGFLAATFRSPRLPAPILALGAAGLPLLAWPPSARLLRRLARQLVDQSAARQDLDATAWHDYEIQWESSRAVFRIDGAVVQDTPVSPRGPLGLVIWIDNQSAAFTPQGRLSFSVLPTPSPEWLEIKDVGIS